MANRANSGRETISIRLDPQLWKEAKLYAIQNDIKIADLVEKALKSEINENKVIG